ncbi:MAG: SMC-Scp complex subunit ScpB [Deltaproteobacteria bacterium RIFCSPLOWO2_02_FULL_46_8]|nr:MAG: SMC-Scp complex subunit ScpB [Deltaproteobacteria bacterium RIFCSPLOWO2_02_FULL_46_8]
MEKQELKPILEALIFASEDPITISGLCLLLQETGVEKGEVDVALQELKQDYNDNPARGLFLREVGGGYQFITKPDLANWVLKLNVSKPRSLSQAALETLAVIAYRQPAVRSELEQIRGVDSGGVLKTLLERGLIKIMGRREEAGQPLIYGTTPAFLELFHLNNLSELPSMKEIEQLVENQQTAVQGELPITEETDFVDQPLAQFSGEESINEEEALVDLETRLTNLKKLEKEMFPKEEAAPATAEATEEPLATVSPLDTPTTE